MILTTESLTVTLSRRYPISFAPDANPIASAVRLAITARSVM